MPFTPFHFGFALLIFALFIFLDPIALIISVAIIDIEPIIYLLFRVGELHGIFHSMFGVIVLFLPVTVMSWIYSKIGLPYLFEYKFNIFSAMCASILGLISHIFFDAIIYPEIMFFYPFSKETGILYGLWSVSIDYLILSIMFLLGVIGILVRLFLRKKIKENKEEK